MALPILAPAWPGPARPPGWYSRRRLPLLRDPLRPSVALSKLLLLRMLCVRWLIYSCACCLV